MRSYAIILLAFLVSCSTQWTDPLTTAVSPIDTNVCLNLPSEQIGEATKAVAAWQRSLKKWRNLEVHTESDTSCNITVRETDQVCPDSSTALACTDDLGGREVKLVRGRYEKDSRGIVLHELGHIFGAQHVDGTLMELENHPGRWACPDKTTVAQVAAYNHINLQLLSYCWQ